MSLLNYRRERLLDVLSRQSQWLSASALHELLKSSSSELVGSLKTTKRDLEYLFDEGYALYEDKGNGLARLWRLEKYRHALTLLPTEAMTLAAIFDHANRFGFHTHTDQLKGLKTYANRVMNRVEKRKIEIEKRITTGTRFLVLAPGKADLGHLKRLQQAICHDEPLEVTYLPRDADGVQCVYQLKPLGLSHQDSNTYLSAYVLEEEWADGYVPDPEKPRGKYSSNGPNSMCALMLHRIVKIEPGKRSIEDPQGYDIHSFEAQQHLMTIHDKDPVDLVLRLSANLYNRLWENPLTQEQELQQESDGWWKLTCRIQDSQGLRLFLLSNAADIEVKKPANLRAHVHDTLQRALTLYGG
jgi:predicted DNA-binding transcriptional regulator YafY